ncbi:hypothetical protein FW754_04070 [Acinetobacter sp. 1207_04]|uniref:HEPN domain-containing protein n=1 Tax=Acinetobacter sp. 1207_04 TaxID=2604449 RepID=UPI004059A8ED
MNFDNDDYRGSKEFSLIHDMYLDYSEDNKILNSILINHAELTSFYSGYNNLYTKSFLVACSNSFEKKWLDFLPNFLSGDNPLTKNFIRTQAVDRKFHTMFDWKNNSAGPFYGAFGEDFKKFIAGKIKADKYLKSKQDAFLELGKLRNLIVHEGIHNFNLQRDIKSVYELFNNSLDYSIFIYQSICDFFKREEIA